MYIMYLSSSFIPKNVLFIIYINALINVLMHYYFANNYTTATIFPHHWATWLSFCLFLKPQLNFVVNPIFTLAICRIFTLVLSHNFVYFTLVLGRLTFVLKKLFVSSRELFYVKNEPFYVSIETKLIHHRYWDLIYPP